MLTCLLTTCLFNMKSFDEWFRDPVPALAPARKAWYDTDDEIVLELLAWNCEETEEVDLVYPCVVCEELTGINVSAIEFNIDMNYCGRSPGCCP